MRLRRRQPIERLYDPSRAARSTARNAFSAAVDPMLTIERTMQKARETSTAFNGMLQRGYTYQYGQTRCVPNKTVARIH